ncbi:hypothetical protein [Nocardia sp. CNY236]|uniref:hypothetical protein n=1 Tax=Nocardia sp. CNY236 TaxID=1169152 RepID=UPI00040A4007|nr:hypothetical protein [Nocardia sp. CNY236]
MADITFPAHIRLRRTPDPTGLPALTADVEVADDIAELTLPTGPHGPSGRQGKPRTTFRKMGEIPNATGRPTDLGPDDRGKWWHRLDDNGMDVWTGTQWRHSPQAVGPQGPLAVANAITVTSTEHEKHLTMPAVEFSGIGAQQQLHVTAPAGPQGPQGPPGVSAPIADAEDYDAAADLTPGSILAYNPGTQKFRPMPTPLGTGPWSWYQEDFNPDATGDDGIDQLIAGSFTIPAQPFAWRPLVQGHISTRGGSKPTEATVRLGGAYGDVVAATAPAVGGMLMLPLIPWYRDDRASKSLSPTSAFATVPAQQEAILLVTVQRTEPGGTISFSRTRASLVVHAHPIGMR